MKKYIKFIFLFVLSFGIAGCSNGSSNSGKNAGNLNQSEIIENYQKYQTWAYSKSQRYGHFQALDYSSSIHNIAERYISASLGVIYSPDAEYEQIKHMIQFCLVDVRTTGEIQLPSVDPKLEKVQFVFNGTESCTVRVYNPSENTFTLISDDAKYVIRKLKSSKTCSVSVRIANGQILRFEFNTEGLNWQYL